MITTFVMQLPDMKPQNRQQMLHGGFVYDSFQCSYPPAYFNKIDFSFELKILFEFFIYICGFSFTSQDFLADKLFLTFHGFFTKN